MAKALILAAHAVVGWAYCGALIGIGRRYLSMETTLVVHAIGAPVGFALLTWLYYRKFGFTRPFVTASVFLAIVVALDVFLVAMVFERSFEMFTSILGTWLPFGLIFGATLLVGKLSYSSPGKIIQADPDPRERGSRPRSLDRQAGLPGGHGDRRAD